MNPYQEWLGWSEPSEPNYYDLLDLNRGEADTTKIAAAADRAIAKVRSCRPGEHAKQWAQLLDEIGQAKTVLLAADARARYDEQLPQPVTPVTPSVTVADDDPEKPTMTVKFAEQTPSAFMLPPVPGEPLIKKSESEPEFTPAPAGDSSPPADSSQSADPPTPAPPVADAPIPATPIPAAPIPAAPTAALTNSVPDSDTMFEEILEEVIPVDEPPPAADLPPVANVPAAAAEPPAAAPPAPAPPESLTPEPTPAPVAAGPPVARAILASPQAMDPMTPVPVAQPVAAAKPMSEVAKPTVVVTAAQGMNWLVLIGGILIGVVGVAAVAFIVMRGGKQPVETTKGEKKPDLKSDKESKKTTPDPKAKKASKEEKKSQTKGEKKSADPSGKKSSTKKKDEKVAKKKQPSDKKKKKTESKKKKAPDTKKKSVTKKKKKKQAPDREPTARDVEALAKALTSAKESLGARDWERADKSFAAVEQLPKSKKHAAMVSRLKMVSTNVRQFWTGVTTTVKGFKGAEEIKVGSTMMIVVDATADSLTVKFLGQSRTFKLDKLPKGVAMALADMALPKDSAKSPVLRGSFLFLQPDLDAQDLKEIRSLWETAELNGVTTTELIKILKDDYDEMSND